ncbi:MAG TPA: hypothetical protein PKK43_07215 [Spirochaetota bacterium]|nr:hypothetical protein [Spirochaetota bacterium]
MESCELRLLLANIIAVIASVIMMIAGSLEMNDALVSVTVLSLLGVFYSL